MTAILDLVEVVETRPDLPDDWPSEDAVEAFGEAYRQWRDTADATLARLRKEREEARC
ncbi:MAG: hypothetical protein PHF64_00285 [Methanoregula sp.]|nr:hypothetical protein [Methanoregula sp.]